MGIERMNVLSCRLWNVRRLAASGLVALALLGVAGCDETSDAGEKIQEAERILSALNAGGASAPAEAQREATYDRVIALLRPVAGSGTAAEKAAAQTIIAQASLGKGQIESSKASTRERGVLMRIQRAGDQIDLVVSHSALADSLGAYDPGAERASLEEEGSRIDDALAKARERRAGVQTQMESLRQRSDSRRAQADGLREQENDLRERAVGLPAAERPAVVQQAVDAQRQADTLEAEVVMISAGLAQLERVGAEIDAEIGQLTTQRSLLDAAGREVDARATTMQEQAAAAREAARRASARMRALIQEIETERSGPLAAAYGAAATLYESALSGLRSGSSAAGSDPEVRTANAVMMGVAQQAVGDLNRQRAGATELYAELLERAAAAAPDSSEAREAASLLGAVREAMDAYDAAADEAYAAAVESFGKVGGSGAVAERVERIIAAIRVDAPEEAPVDEGVEPGTEEPATDAAG